MYILKNAFTSIKRNKGRNILIGIIVMIISCSLTVSLAIKNTSDSLIQSYEEANEITASITFNRGMMMDKFNPENKDNLEEMKENFSNISPISIEDIETYAKSDLVSNYYYTSSLGVNSDIEKATGDFSFGNKPNSHGLQNKTNSTTDFTLMGYSNSLAMQEFINGQYSLSDYDEKIWSRMLNEEVCLINSELATLNNISVGNIIEIVDPEDKNNTYSLEVIGIFKENSSEESAMNLFSSSANTIITNTKVIKEIINNNEELQVNNIPYFTLKSKENMERFQNELIEKGLDENYTITTNEKEIEGAISSISNVANFASVFLIITLIIGIVILLVINCINIRERKYEIGVLRTIGMKKSLLASQFILELVIISFLGLILGAGIGAISSKPISNHLLSNEIKESEKNTQNMKENFGGQDENKRPNMNNLDFNKMGGVAKVEAFESIDAVVNKKVIAELIGIGLILTIFSSLAAIINIVRFRPLDILKERN